MTYGSANPPYSPFLSLSAALHLHSLKYRCTGRWECRQILAREAAWCKRFGAPPTITGGDTNSSISVGECVRGEGAWRRECWEQRQTSSIPELCAHIFVSLSSRVSSADTAWRKGLRLFILSRPSLPCLRPFAEGVCVCSSGAQLDFSDLLVMGSGPRSFLNNIFSY